MIILITLDQVTWQNILLIRPNSAEPIGRLASQSQYIYLQISTSTLFLCPPRDCLRSFFSSFIQETKPMDPTVHRA